MKKILFIGSTIRQTWALHEISKHLETAYQCYFTPYYADGLVDVFRRFGWLESTILGESHQKATLNYIKKYNLKLDHRGNDHDYDLVVTGSDLVVQNNIRGKKLLLVQEEITVPDTPFTQLVEWLTVPRLLANTSANGLSDRYDIFCVASQGYADRYVRKGLNPEKIKVTGIPRYASLQDARHETTVDRGVVHFATTPLSEPLKPKVRKAYLKEATQIADGRKIRIKLLPKGHVRRAKRQLRKIFPLVPIVVGDNLNQHFARSRESICVLTAFTMAEKLHIFSDAQDVLSLMQVEQQIDSAEKIAKICRHLLNTPLPEVKDSKSGLRTRLAWE